MNRYEVTPYVLGALEGGVAYIDAAPMKVIEAESSFEAARKYRIKKVQFHHVRLIK